MLPVTQTSLVSKMGNVRVNDRVPADLQTFVRTEFGGNGTDAEWLLTQARRSARSASPKSSRRGVLSALFEALGAAFPRPGGA